MKEVSYKTWQKSMKVGKETFKSIASQRGGIA